MTYGRSRSSGRTFEWSSSQREQQDAEPCAAAERSTASLRAAVARPLSAVVSPLPVCNAQRSKEFERSAHGAPTYAHTAGKSYARANYSPGGSESLNALAVVHVRAAG